MGKTTHKTVDDIPMDAIIKYADKVLDAVNQGATDEQALFFLSTFKRYKTQLELLDKIQQELLEAETLVTEKEYVKGKTTLQTHPLLTTYNSMCSSANTTVKTLISIIKQLDSATIGATVDDEFEEFLKM